MNTPLNDALMPCPFCGTVPHLIEMNEWTGIECGSDCDKTGLCIAFSSDKKESAIAAWNTRAQLSAQVKENAFSLNNDAVKLKEVTVVQPVAVTLETAPIGTRAPAINGGHWYRTQFGWQWNGPFGSGGTFPRPGGDWNGELILPADADAVDAKIAMLTNAIEITLRENAHLADGEDCTLIHLKRAIAAQSTEGAKG